LGGKKECGLSVCRLEMNVNWRLEVNWRYIWLSLIIVAVMVRDSRPGTRHFRGVLRFLCNLFHLELGKFCGCSGVLLNNSKAHGLQRTMVSADKETFYRSTCG
jgi:hypothetical protein